MFLDSDDLSYPQTSHYGADCTETEPAVWLLGDEGEAWDGRLWTRLPVSAPCKFCRPPVCWWEHNPQPPMSLWRGFMPCLCLEQESGEKIAVKLCRLELNSKNKDRWSREIQIMKKWVQLKIVCLCSQRIRETNLSVHFVLVCCGLSLSQAQPCECGSGQRSSWRVEHHCFKWLTSIVYGVLLKRRPTQGIMWVFYRHP